ncbi:MAG TPA: hypothetical protein VGA12_11900 [Burkholderiales bacterium]|jgi:hypothetical protein
MKIARLSLLLSLALPLCSGAALAQERFSPFELLQDTKLRGEDISFTLMMTIENVGFVRHHFHGKVRGEVIIGTASVSLPPHENTLELPWRARLTEDSAYFTPAGTNVQ